MERMAKDKEDDMVSQNEIILRNKMNYCIQLFVYRFIINILQIIQNSIYNIMNLNLQLNTEHYKQSPIKSPRKITPENNQKYKPRDKNIETLQYKNLIRAYRKEVQLPINFQTSIFVSKTPQRCLQHNHPITLYCLTDKKPLCIHCMYQLLTHKKHEVIPVNKANQSLKLQLQTLLKNINTNIFPIMTHLIQKNSQNIQKIQSQMIIIIQKINKFYNQLIQLLNNMKSSYINTYHKWNQQLSNHYRNFASQISKIKQYTLDKLKQVEEKVGVGGDEKLLFQHNIAMHLSKLGLILTPQFCQYRGMQEYQLGIKLQSVSKEIKKLVNQNIDKMMQGQLQKTRKVEQKSSLSPKASKNAWNYRKKINFDMKDYSLNKIKSNPKLHSGLTPRDGLGDGLKDELRDGLRDVLGDVPRDITKDGPRDGENNKKKQFYFNIFHKHKNDKEVSGRPPKYYQRKSQTNRLVLQK